MTSISGLGGYQPQDMRVGFNPFGTSGAAGGPAQQGPGPDQRLDQGMLAEKSANFKVGLGGTNDPVDANGKRPSLHVIG